MWTCPKCGEQQDDSFDACWKCSGEGIKIALTSKEGKIFSFKGRIPRATFWIINISIFVFNVVVSLVILDLSSVEGRGIGVLLLMLFLILLVLGTFFITVWGGVTSQVQRWHDRNKSGWMVLINLTGLGLVWSFIELGFLRGTVGPNQYGEEPLEGQEKKVEPVSKRKE